MTLADSFDDAERPPGPRFALEPGRRQVGRRLAMIHRMHLAQLREVESVIAAIDAGLAQPGAVLAAADRMAMTRNMRMFGTLCGEECQALTFHHGAEDAYVFPALRVGDAALDRLLDRLAAEHLVIHGWIDRLAERVSAFRAGPGPDAYRDLRETFQTLARLVRSHFGYEETQLEDSLGHYEVPL
jgi:hypothetical protein